MKNFLKTKILLFVFVLVFVWLAGSFLFGWTDPCANDRCDSARLQGCEMICRHFGGCAGYSYYGGCEHGICVFYVKYYCVDGETSNQIVLCSG
jgi:hypothetical protein